MLGEAKEEGGHVNRGKSKGSDGREKQGEKRKDTENSHIGKNDAGK